MKKVAILQSNYIPWKGYFDLINIVDDFVIYDDAQYSKNDWRNRNIVKTPNGKQWLTIPVYHESLNQKINEIAIADSFWAKKHWKTISQLYSKTQYFNEYKEIFETLYMNINTIWLSEINLIFINIINKILGIKTNIISSSDFVLPEGRNNKLIYVNKVLGADIYISGPAARDYINESAFNKEGIQVEWIDYSGYKEYQQLHPPFEHAVTILDLIFNTGKNARSYMKSFL